MATLSIKPFQSTADGPWATRVAPTIPPIRACEDDDGSPNHHVVRFNAIAPISPAKTVSSVIEVESTMPLAIVAATASDRNAPTKFRLPDIATATRGDRDRVDT